VDESDGEGAIPEAIVEDSSQLFSELHLAQDVVDLSLLVWSCRFELVHVVIAEVILLGIRL
jgi:hypothetical protein